VVFMYMLNTIKPVFFFLENGKWLKRRKKVLVWLSISTENVPTITQDL